MRTDRARLLAQWHPSLNGELTPDRVSGGSDRKVWWRCEQGHEWQATVHSRTGKGTGCPVCTGRQAWAGHNDLAATHPQLCAQWDREKNGELTPEQVKACSHKKVWWRCGKGHSWQASIYARTAGTGCPVCANRVIVPGCNDLATTHPALAEEWDREKNGDLTPERVGAGYGKKVWWRCEKGHSWQAAVHTRAEKSAGCPVCANRKAAPGENDLTTLYPRLAAQWHPTKNGTLAPEDVTPGSSRTVWWQCEQGHAWRAKVLQRVRGASECPYCCGQRVLAGFNDLASLAPQVAAQWHPTLNGDLTPEMVTAGSSRRVWWICHEGHVWRACVANRALPGYKNTGCPICAGRVRAGFRCRIGGRDANG